MCSLTEVPHVPVDLLNQLSLDVQRPAASMGRSGVPVAGASTAHKARNAKHAAASAPKPAPPPHRRHHRIKAALHVPRGKKRGDVEVLDLVSDATSDSEDSDSDSDVEIVDAPFVENEVLVLSDDDDDDDDDYDFRARADEVVLSSDEEEDDSDDQVVIVSDNLAQGKTAGKAAAATPARFRKARDPAADLKWFMPYANAPMNQDVRLSVSSPRWNQQRNCSHPFSSSNSRTLGRTNLACTGIR